MSKPSLIYLYGPVYSWRMGMSLGIDPITDGVKICNMDCVYCQLGKTVEWVEERQNFVPVESIINEIKSLPPVDIDYLTFSGRGEPTLAKNLGEMIRALRSLRKEKIAVITNAAMIDRPDVQEDLALCDLVLAKLDAADQESFEAVDVTKGKIDFNRVVQGIKDFRKKYKGKLALQLMFVQQNKKYAERMAAITRAIAPDEIEINTPLRPSAAIHLNEAEIAEVKHFFQGQPAITVYEKEKKIVQPMDEQATIKRHGNYKKSKL